MTLSAFLIAGPTASGKSALAVRLARAFGGMVINADSMQVYADLRVLSARPDAHEQEAARHTLFGHVDGGVNYSVGHWLADVKQAVDCARALGLIPLITGGTGLYFKALMQGLSPVPSVPEAVRAAVRATHAGQTAAGLHERLAACDPLMAAKLRPSDPQRILRALEVFAATGRSLAHFQAQRAVPMLPDAVGLFLEPPRDDLRAAIDSRFGAMLAQGALAEAQVLAARHLDPALPVMRAHGVPHLMAMLRGEISLAQATSQSQADTRAYARRQHTFARHQLPQLPWCAPSDAYERAAAVLGAATPNAANAEKTFGKT